MRVIETSPEVSVVLYECRYAEFNTTKFTKLKVKKVQCLRIAK